MQKRGRLGFLLRIPVYLGTLHSISEKSNWWIWPPTMMAVFKVSNKRECKEKIKVIAEGRGSCGCKDLVTTSYKRNRRKRRPLSTSSRHGGWSNSNIWWIYVGIAEQRRCCIKWSIFRLIQSEKDRTAKKDDANQIRVKERKKRAKIRTRLKARQNRATLRIQVKATRMQWELSTD